MFLVVTGLNTVKTSIFLKKIVVGLVDVFETNYLKLKLNIFHMNNLESCPVTYG